jgi:hypothetical protein
MCNIYSTICINNLIFSYRRNPSRRLQSLSIDLQGRHHLVPSDYLEQENEANNDLYRQAEVRSDVLGSDCEFEDGPATCDLWRVTSLVEEACNNATYLPQPVFLSATYCVFLYHFNVSYFTIFPKCEKVFPSFFSLLWVLTYIFLAILFLST